MSETPKKFVFRVANGRNEGPFRGGGWWNREQFHSINKFNNEKHYPNYCDDGLCKFGESNYITAMPNACALFHWFGEDLDMLNKKKFKVYRVEVKNMKMGTTGFQCVYHRRCGKVGKMQQVPIKYKGLLL